MRVNSFSSYSPIILVVFSLLPWCVTAQIDSLQLQEITVTSSIIPTEASRTGRNINVIMGEAFAKLPVNSVEELLRYVPGLEVQSRGPMGAQSDFVIRGGTFQQVLVILDGLRLNDPNSGHFTSYIPITPAQIDRIEVLKGASSALYGSDAVGGVINIITKAFAAKAKQKSTLNGQIAGGEYGLFNINAGGSYSTKNTNLDAGVLSNNALGQPQRGINGYFHNTTVSAGVNHRLGKSWSAGLRSSYDSRDFAAQNFYTTFLSDTAREKVTTSWNQIRLAHEGVNNKFMVQAGYKEVNDNYKFSSVSLANQSKSTLIQSLVTYEHSFNERTSLIGGLQFQQRKISSNDRGEHAINQAAVFVLLRQSIGRRLTVSPALRLDNDERSGTELVPQLNISYATSNLQLRGSVGKTIRQADFTERYNNYNKVLVTSGRIGNPDLFAEQSISYETGADYWLAGNSIKLSGTLFQQRFSKLIDYVTTPYNDMPRKDNLTPAGTYALARNISDVVTSGAEIDVFYKQPLTSGANVFSTMGLIVLNSDAPGGTPSLYLSSHARFLMNFTAGYGTDRYSISATGVYKTRGRQEASAINAQLSSEYFVMNLKGEYFIVRNKFSGFIQVDNLFDEKYSDVLGAVMPGRWIMAGIKVNF
ncbi:TonB-dependent receptor [soil metagenome]